jgi:hypothetical protein
LEGKTVNKGMKIVTCIFATIGLACIVKHIMHHKERFCGWHKIKVEDEKSTAEAAPHERKEDEKQTGTRYGSNPVKY